MEQSSSQFLISTPHLVFLAILDALEMGCQLANHGVSDFTLKMKGSGEAKTFGVLSEEKLTKSLDHKGRVAPFDMDKLEVEYDYDTENEQIT